MTGSRRSTAPSTSAPHGVAALCRSWPLLLVALTAPALAEPGAWIDPPAKVGQPDAKGTEPNAAPVAAPSPPSRPRARSQARADQPARTATHAAAPGLAPRGEVGTRGAAAFGPSDAAQRIVVQYLAAVSSNAGLRSSASQFYGPQVRFHGRVMTRGALAAEKARFARRWPDRRYEPRGVARTACDAAGETCTVTTAFVFQAANPDRGARSAGIGELTMTLGFDGARAVILSESSRVLRRGTAALSGSPSTDGPA